MNRKDLKAIHELAESCAYEEEHTLQVTRLALELFDQLSDLHGLGKRDRFLLQCGSLLHDIGWCRGIKGHHKSAMKLVLEAKGLPLDDTERVMVALIARYHRKAEPSASHPYYCDLGKSDQRKVEMLSALLRVADGLDRSHCSAVKALRCKVSRGRIAIECELVGDGEVERWAAMRKAELFQRVFECELSIEPRPVR